MLLPDEMQSIKNKRKETLKFETMSIERLNYSINLTLN